MIRFAFYGRLSTTDKQDASLARPSQLAACERKAAELGGVLATAADIWVGKASWTLYTNASARIEKVIGLQPAAVSSPATT